MSDSKIYIVPMGWRGDYKNMRYTKVPFANDARFTKILKREFLLASLQIYRPEELI